MQNNHFIHDLFIVIGISLLSTISITISIFPGMVFFILQLSNLFGFHLE